METKHAWYIVGKPSSAYAGLFRGFELAHELTHMLFSSCLQDHQITVSTFKERIEEEYPLDIVQCFEDILRDDDKVHQQFIMDGYFTDCS